MAKRTQVGAYYTWAHNIDGCLRNGSFVRGEGPRFTQYMNGDYMGTIEKIPDGMSPVSAAHARNLIPACCR
jgi:hypothetical protein